MSITTDTELLALVLDDLAPVFAGVGIDRFHDPTPCSEFDVEELRRHILGWLTLFADGFADPSNQGRPGIRRYVMPSYPEAELDSAATRLIENLRNGAAEQPLLLGLGAMPGDEAVSLILWEYLVHGWDLAIATGQRWLPSDEALERSIAFAPTILTPVHQGDGKMFAERVPVDSDASTLDVLLGLSGRDPQWNAR